MSYKLKSILKSIADTFELKNCFPCSAWHLYISLKLSSPSAGQNTVFIPKDVKIF